MGGRQTPPKSWKEFMKMIFKAPIDIDIQNDYGLLRG